MSGVNGASDALGMGPSAGYTLNNSMITVLCVLTVSIGMSYLHAIAFVGDIHMHIYVVTNLLMLYFWIKLTMKMPNYLTPHRVWQQGGVGERRLRLLPSGASSGAERPVQAPPASGATLHDFIMCRCRGMVGENV
jgi:hypothetical protein